MAKTAPLNRYLAALDSPSAVNSKCHDNRSGNSSRSDLAVFERDPNEFETNFPETRFDLQNGHKVATMPQSREKSIGEEANDIVYRRSAIRDDVARNAGRRRSHSAGRATSARNIVQDVYDRLGFSRGELQVDKSMDSSKERFQSETLLSPAVTPQKNQGSSQPARGRSIDRPCDTDGQRRARSLSRGRSVAGRWPPTKDHLLSQNGDSGCFLNSPEPTRVDSGKDFDISEIKQGYFSPQNKSRNQTTQKDYTNIPSISSCEDGFLRLNRMVDTTTSKMKSSPSRTNSGMLGGTQPSFEERISSQDSDGNTTSDKVNLTSVRDRVSALSGKSSNRNFPQRSYPIKYSKREYPPPIDIYAGGAHVQDSQHDNEESNSLENSTALSSMSTDEFQQDRLCNVGSRGVSSNQPTMVGRRWTPNNKTTNNTTPTTSSSKSANSVSSTQDLVERIVRERLQTQVADMETRMEAQVMRMEKRLEERMQARIDSLEAKMDKIGEMMSSLFTGGAID